MGIQNVATLVEALEKNAAVDIKNAFCFFGLDGTERTFSSADLYKEALRRGALLREQGLRRGDRVSLIFAEPHEFVLSFIGASVAGLVPVPMYPRATFKAIDTYTDTVAHIVETAGSKVILTMQETLPYVEPATAKIKQLDKVLTIEKAFAGQSATMSPEKVDASDLCFLQFTSGSTNKPKGVIVRHQNVIANTGGSLAPETVNLDPDTDMAVSWLPLYHDMGLIGFVLASIAHRMKTVLLPTSTFARSPKLWLETIHKYRGTITYAPNFAYGLLAKRLKDADVASLDLSCVRVAGCGAEPIQAQTLRDFAAKLAPAGFKPEAFLPSYGMAEGTLAISFHALHEPMRTLKVNAAALSEGRVEMAKSDDVNAIELVSCGKALKGHEIKIVGDQGAVLGEDRVGEIATRGPSVCDGYFENPEATAEMWKDGWLHTGDLGFFHEGNLYICGRAKDLIIIKGANYYPQDIEWAVGQVPGVRAGKVVAFGVTKNNEEQLVVVAECASMQAKELSDLIVKKIYEATGLPAAEVVMIGLGGIPLTSSGKLQRRKTRELYLNNTLELHTKEG